MCGSCRSAPTTPRAIRATRWRRCRRAWPPGEFASPYLYDESQEVARSWGAKTTPHVFVSDASGVVYSGAPDGDYGDPAANAEWLRAALDDVLAGRPVAKSETKPVGCSIKWR